MYKIIGSDGREYGPVSADQLRQWIAEGRVNAQTQIRAEDSADWKTLNAFPEFTALPAPPPVRGPVELNIGNCVSRSWELLKAHFGLLVGATLLILLMLGIVGTALRLGTNLACGVSFGELIQAHGVGRFRLQLPGILVSSIWYFVMTGPLMGGLYNLYLKLIRGQPAGIGDAFAGFGPQFGQLVLGSFVVSFLSMMGFFLCVIPGLYLSVGWKFTLPAIIDKRLGFWEGMEASRQAVSGRWWPVFALLLLTGLIAAAGMLACCVGIFVTMPIAIGAIMYAYEDLVGVQLPAPQ
jgi:hypothetical protein